MMQGERIFSGNVFLQLCMQLGGQMQTVCFSHELSAFLIVQYGLFQLIWKKHA